MKRILLALILSIAMVTPAFASAPVITESLTVDQATDAAIAASNELRNLEDTVVTNNETLENLKDQFQTEWDYSKVLSLAVQIMQLETKNSQANNNSGLARDNLRISVMNLFSSIINAQNALKLTDQSLDIQKRKLDIAKVKHEIGYLSKLDYDILANSYKQKQAARETQSIAIDNAFISLNKIMGYTLTKKYNLILNLSYKPVAGNINLAGAVNSALRNDPSAVNQQANVNVAEYKKEMYDPDVSTDTEESLKRDINQAERSMYETERGIEQKVINAYNDIKEQEIKYDNAVLELEALKLKLPLLLKKVELGKITKLELDELYYQIAQQEETIRSLAYSHEIRVLQFNNPGTL